MQDDSQKAKRKRKPARKATHKVTDKPSIVAEDSATNGRSAPSLAPAMVNGSSGVIQSAQCADDQQQQQSFQSKTCRPPWAKAWQGGVLLAIAAALLLSGPLAGEH